MLVRVVYGDDGGIERAIGPAETRGELRKLVSNRSSYARSLRLGPVVDASTVNCSKYSKPNVPESPLFEGHA